MSEDLTSEIPHNFDGHCYSNNWKRHKLSTSKSELRNRSLRKGRYSDSETGSHDGSSSDDDVSDCSSHSRSSGRRQGYESGENLASKFYDVKEEAEMWVLTQVYLDPKPRHWAKLFKASDKTPAIVIGSENGGPNPQGPRVTKFIFFCYDGYSHADNTSKDDEYTYDRHRSWSLSSRPFGGFCQDFELRVYQYIPFPRRQKVHGRALGWLQANLFIPVDEHEFAGGFSSTPSASQTTTTGALSSVKGLVKRGLSLTITSDYSAALKSLQSLSPQDISTFLCGSMEVIARPPRKGSNPADTIQNQAALLEILRIIFSAGLPMSNDSPVLSSSATTSSTSAADEASMQQQHHHRLISSLVRPHTLVLSGIDEGFPEDLLLQIVGLRLTGLPRLVLSSSGGGTSSSVGTKQDSASSSKKPGGDAINLLRIITAISSAVEEETTSSARADAQPSSYKGGLEEVVFPQVTVRLTTQLANAILRLSQLVHLGDERKMYDAGPSCWREQIRSMLPTVDVISSVPLLLLKQEQSSSSSVGASEKIVIKFHSCSPGQVWYLSKREAQYCNLVRNMLQHSEDFEEGEQEEAPAGEGDLEEIPDAGTMDPIPSPRAISLVRHFLRYFVTPELHHDCNLDGIDGYGGGDQQNTSYLDEEGREAGPKDTPGDLAEEKKRKKHPVSRWNSLFEAFFLLHIQVSSSSSSTPDSSQSHREKSNERAVAQQCWLLGELWGISCYLEIPTLRAFCREAWSRLTAEANRYYEDSSRRNDEDLRGPHQNGVETTMSDSSSSSSSCIVTTDDDDDDDDCDDW